MWQHLSLIPITIKMIMTITPSIIAVTLAGFCISVQAAGTLSVSTWGGEHGEAIDLEFLTPFSEHAGVSVSQNTLDSLPDSLTVPEGIVELSLHDAIDRCDNNQIMLLPTESLEASEASKRIVEDFLPNTLQPCAVGHSVWAKVMTYNSKQFDNANKPHLISDFFNTAYYPGKRVMRKSPQVLIEWALVANGIQNTDVYKALDDSETAWSLIEKKLNLIRQDIIWVESDVDALEFLHSGKATFALVGNDSLVRYSANQSVDLGVLWDAAVTELAMWAIPTDAPDPVISWEFLKYATSVTHSGKVASVFGYGPVRYSTLDLIDKNYHRLLPTSPQNKQNLIWGNSKWWRESSTVIVSRFADWLIEIEQQTALTLASASEELPIESHLALGDIKPLQIDPRK